MQKKIKENLKSLAHRILRVGTDVEISLLKKEVLHLYDELCVIEYLLNKPKKPPKKPKKIKDEGYTLFSIEDEIGVDANFEDIFIKKDDDEMESITIPFDTSTTLKDKTEVTKQDDDTEIKEESIEAPKPINTLIPQTKVQASLNDKINQSSLSIDLNDRIAFVNNLFEGSQEDFNRVLSQLNSFENEHEAKDFLLNKVKPDYSWQGHESYEERLIFLIERKFM